MPQRALPTDESMASTSKKRKRSGTNPAIMEIPVDTADEPRWVLIGKIGERHWSAVITRRGENIRIISVRPSREEEVEIYESESI